MWNYYKDEVNDPANEKNDANNFRINIRKTTSSKSFEYKTKSIGSTPTNDCRFDAEGFVSLKYLSNFWRSLDLPLINCEIELDLPWSRYCVISEVSRTSRGVSNTDPVRYKVATTTNSITFQLDNANLYFPIVTLSIVCGNIKFLENIKQIFKRLISWNKYRHEITTQPKNNLDYLIDPTFRNINRLFVLLFKNGNNDPIRIIYYIYILHRIIYITCH